MQRAQNESAVETIDEGGETTGRVLSEIERMLAPPQTSFEVAQHDVDPLKLGTVVSLVRRGWRSSLNGTAAMKGT